MCYFYPLVVENRFLWTDFLCSVMYPSASKRVTSTSMLSKCFVSDETRLPSLCFVASTFPSKAVFHLLMLAPLLWDIKIFLFKFLCVNCWGRKKWPIFSLLLHISKIPSFDVFRISQLILPFCSLGTQGRAHSQLYEPVLFNHFYVYWVLFITQVLLLLELGNASLVSLPSAPGLALAYFLPHWVSCSRCFL